jgi:hypothetical protein
MWHNMMRSTKSQKVSILHYSIDFYINLYTRGERLGPTTGPVLIWIKFVCFLVNIVSVLINVCLLL